MVRGAVDSGVIYAALCLKKGCLTGFVMWRDGGGGRVFGEQAFLQGFFLNFFRFFKKKRFTNPKLWVNIEKSGSKLHEVA